MQIRNLIIILIANRTLNDGSTELKLTRNGCSAVVTFHLILRFSLHEKPENQSA